ncbi:hypothetical protein LEP1GSC199_2630 [Leptospira vanthielii serovar Holland str. Waz Holland = ATCC 700522]|uniref:Uncharacterized protein n=1 Tax=Leptospira vanthielii serovar Holland str. Waz Holland = ATCC 700522 TaxID=1218591 RepID=N1WDL0_9LEPT|nr:hypothetical protein LEP1GSC199_2630 [Leptospira vanthielii serovar Holland str. Waz Holland = ATCC 700522]
MINWEEVSSYLLGRLRQEARLGKRENFELYKKISSFLPKDQTEFVPKENLPHPRRLNDSSYSRHIPLIGKFSRIFFE